MTMAMTTDAIAAFPPSLDRLAIAAAIGLLIGTERGWTRRDEAPGRRVAGFRTFGLLGLGGGVIAMLPPAPAMVVAAGAALLLLLGYARESGAGENISATNMLAALLTMALGILAGSGSWMEALAMAAVVTLLLSVRETSHRWLRGMNDDEMRSLARFALIAFVILPLMPDRQMGPLDAWNPRELWTIVVLVSGLSFAGYVAMRRLGGGHGLYVLALCASLVSSTAVTTSFARDLRADSRSAGALAGGIAIASAVMFARVLVLAAFLTPFVVARLATILLPALILALLAVGWQLKARPGTAGGDPPRLSNPLALGPAVALAALVAVLALATRWMRDQLGHLGMIGLLALTGFADVDAAVLALSTLPSSALTPDVAATALAVPVLLNTLLKAGIVIGVAGGRSGLRAAFPLIASSVVSAATMAILAWAVRP